MSCLVVINVVIDIDYANNFTSNYIYHKKGNCIFGTIIYLFVGLLFIFDSVSGLDWLTLSEVFFYYFSKNYNFDSSFYFQIFFYNKLFQSVTNTFIV